MRPGKSSPKLKHHQRKTAERPLEATWKRIGVLLNCFLLHECQAYLENAEYGSTKIHHAIEARIVSPKTTQLAWLPLQRGRPRRS
jgi:hypothetical protein